MDLELLNVLRRKVDSESDLHEIMVYFMDHFGDDPKFLPMGRRIDDDKIEVVVKMSASVVIGAQEPPQWHSLQVRVDKYRFVHGPIGYSGGFGMFIYFEDLDKGIVSLYKHDGGGLTHYIRFSVETLVGEYVSTAMKFNQ